MSGKVAAAAASGIPASARKLVQSLKEIVNCPEAEIYATLKDCDMNPDAALDRLFTQGFCFSD
jgi:GBF-interacting protein 1 N-terminal